VSQLVEEELPTATPASPKKRGRKSKRVAAKADNLPTQNVVEAPGTTTADEPTDDTHIGSNLKSKRTPVPTRDPLPAREGRNTHPGVHFGLQPTPRRSSQQVAAARERKRQELEEKLKATDALKEQLALMDLEEERIEEALEEQGRRRLEFVQNDESSGDEDFALDDVDTNEEDSPSPEPEKEVRTHSPNDLRSTTYHQISPKVKVKVKVKVQLEKLLREHCARISRKRRNDCVGQEGKKVRHELAKRKEGESSLCYLWECYLWKFSQGFLVFDASLSGSTSHSKTSSRGNITKPVLQTQLPWATSSLNPSLVAWTMISVRRNVQLHSVRLVPRLCPLSHLACSVIATGGTRCVLVWPHRRLTQTKISWLVCPAASRVNVAGLRL
jgi:hypothetical protein